MGTGQNRDVLFYDPEAEAKVKQMRKAAELMRENAKMGAPNEMAGRVVYKKSPFEYLAKMGSSLIAGNEERKAEENDAAYKKRRSDMLAQAVQNYGEDPSQMAKIMMQDPSMMGAGIGIMSDERKMQLEQEKLKREQDLIASGMMPGKDFQSQLYNRLLPSMGVSGAANAASSMQTFTGPDGAIYRAPSRAVPQLDGGGAPTQGFGLGGSVPPMNDVPNPQTPQQINAQVPDVAISQPELLGDAMSTIGQMNQPAVTSPSGTMVVAGKTPEQKAQEAFLKTEAEKQAALSVEKRGDLPKIKAMVDSVGVKAQNLNRTIDEASSLVSNWSAGYGSLLSGLPATDAKDLSAKLDTIKANLGFNELQEMRNNSPTGGALGQVTERELAFLQSTISSLDQAQSPEQLKASLATIKEHVAGMNERINAAYQADLAKYGAEAMSGVNPSMGASPPQEQEQAIPAGVSADDWKYMTPEERALFK